MVRAQRGLDNWVPEGLTGFIGVEQRQNGCQKIDRVDCACSSVLQSKSEHFKFECAEVLTCEAFCHIEKTSWAPGDDSSQPCASRNLASDEDMGNSESLTVRRIRSDCIAELKLCGLGSANAELMALTSLRTIGWSCPMVAVSYLGLFRGPSCA